MCESSRTIDLEPLPQDVQLRLLVQQTCTCAQGSKERQPCLDRLIREIVASGKLLRRGNIPEPDFQDILQKSWIYFCQNLCEATTAQHPYDPTRASVITWFNAYLRMRIVDYWRDRRPLPLPDYWEPVAPPEPPPILEELLAWLEQEQRALLRVHVRDHPEVNCKTLILRRLPPPTSFKQLAQELQVPETTLQSFYTNQCLPRLRQAGKKLGYLETV
jgi:DNA-directed RNA polymerase specialized sigma24 family protein